MAARMRTVDSCKNGEVSSVACGNSDKCRTTAQNVHDLAKCVIIIMEALTEILIIGAVFELQAWLFAFFPLSFG